MGDVLGLLTEVLLPESLAKLCWTLRDAGLPKDEHVALLDYLETELTFAEFLRILLRITERATKPAVFSGPLPLHRRVEDFLEHVLFPALSKPYVPPEPPPA